MRPLMQCLPRIWNHQGSNSRSPTDGHTRSSVRTRRSLRRSRSVILSEASLRNSFEDAPKTEGKSPSRGNPAPQFLPLHDQNRRPFPDHLRGHSLHNDPGQDHHLELLRHLQDLGHDLLPDEARRPEATCRLHRQNRTHHLDDLEILPSTTDNQRLSLLLRDYL